MTKQKNIDARPVFRRGDRVRYTAPGNRIVEGVVKILGLYTAVIDVEAPKVDGVPNATRSVNASYTRLELLEPAQTKEVVGTREVAERTLAITEDEAQLVIGMLDSIMGEWGTLIDAEIALKERLDKWLASL